MQKIILLLLISANCFGNESSLQVDFVNALNDINEKNIEAGLEVIQRTFNKTNNSILKAKCAYILSVSKKMSRGKKAKLGHFAFSNHNLLSNTQRAELGRITGDLYFKMGELEKAQELYKQTLQIKGVEAGIIEYVTYKLGWVYANNRDYLPLFKLYSHWTKSNSKGDLMDVINRDYGKFFAEYYLSTENPQYIETPNYPILSPYYNQFTSGLANGIKRLRSRPPHHYLARFKDDRYFTRGLNVALKHSHYFEKRPCESIRWIQLANSEILDHIRSEYLLSKCFVRKKKGFDLTSLLLALNSIKLSNTGKIIKAEVLSLSGRVDGACREFLLILNSENRQKGETKNAIKGLYNNCHQVTQRNHGPYRNFLNLLLSEKISDSNSILTLISRPKIIKKTIKYLSEETVVRNDEVVRQFIKYTQLECNTRLALMSNHGIEANSKELKNEVLYCVNHNIKINRYQAALTWLEIFTNFQSQDVNTLKLWYYLSKNEKFQNRFRSHQKNKITLNLFSALTKIPKKKLSRGDRRLVTELFISGISLPQIIQTPGFKSNSQLKNLALKRYLNEGASPQIEKKLEKFNLGSVVLYRNKPNDLLNLKKLNLHGIKQIKKEIRNYTKLKRFIKNTVKFTNINDLIKALKKYQNVLAYLENKNTVTTYGRKVYRETALSGIRKMRKILTSSQGSLTNEVVSQVNQKLLEMEEVI